MATLAVASDGANRAEARWVVTDLGTLGRGHWASEALAINDRGQIVGMSVNREGQFQYGGHAFLWEKGRIRDLGALRGLPNSWATDINNRGQIVGSSFTIDESGRLGKARAVVWEKGRIRALASLESLSASEAFAINDRGAIVGWAGDRWYSHDSPRPVLWQRGTMRVLAVGEGLATGLNAHTQVVGITGSIDPNGAWYDLEGFVWTKGDMVGLGALGGDGWRDGHDNWVNDISDRGLVVGGRLGRATVWTDGVPRALAGIRGAPRQRSEANAINERGQIVGQWHATPSTDDWTGSAALWKDGKLTLLPNLPGGTGSAASAINLKGQIVGWAYTKRGDYHAVLWTLKS